MDDLVTINLHFTNDRKWDPRLLSNKNRLIRHRPNISMENLSLEDRPAQPTPPPQMAPQLPPQMFTTAAQLLNLTDKKLVVVLRDGRKLIGVLRSWDQYANLVLQDTIERLFVNDLYADIKHGLYIVRGENVLLLGEIDLDQEDNIPEPFKEADPNVVRGLLKQEADNKKKKEKSRGKLLHNHGFERDFGGDAII